MNWRRLRRSAAACVCWLVLGLPLAVSAQDAGVDAGPVVAAAGADPRTAEIRALIDGTLDPSIDPQDLFDVSLDDASAIQVDLARARTLLEAVDHKAHASAPKVGKRADAGTDRAAATVTESVDPVRWRARLDLDRARVAFYSLAPAQRTALLRAQAQRREAAHPGETESERTARAAEAERQRALAAARTARSEAERAVGEELARVIGVQARVAAVVERFRERKETLVARHDAVLGWQRRVRDTKGSTGDADALYAELRGALRRSRDELDRALDDFAAPSLVPTLAVDHLDEIPSDVPAKALLERRKLVAREIASARKEGQAIRRERAASLLDEISTLNGERLSLLPRLSPDARDAITGFTARGGDQARSEARQLLLILRYHRHIVLDWIGAIRGGGSTGISTWRIVAVFVPWCLVVLTFAWWRRRSHTLFALGEERLAAIDRSERRVSPSPAHQAFRILLGVHRPLEWLLFFGATVWILPAATQRLLEVQLLSSIVGWTLGGALIVDAINAIAARSSRALSPIDDGIGRLRLRSLRLVGRVTVVLALILVLSARLVGEGTLYQWVLSTCWMAAVPVFLILVRWWRSTVFERVDRVRKKTAVQAWILANRRGWKSFLAAMIGAIELFAIGALKATRNWIASFKLARHADAYLFRRGLDRLESEKSLRTTEPLRASAFAALSPDAPLEGWVACSADERVALLLERVRARRGGVIALVGGRGQGKSSVLRKLCEAEPSSVRFGCTSVTTAESLRTAIQASSKQPEASALIAIDDAQALLKPVVGGLATFDDVFAFARAHAERTLWVFAIDAVLWPFLRRARDARPLFDEVWSLEPWTEEQIGALLSRRSGSAGIAPTFEDLLDHLPINADEIDRQDALALKRDGYVRMLWDHVRGNPGLALQAWRASLVEDDEAMVRVRSLQVPDIGALERLPEAALFILRAVLQLGPVCAADVVEVTRLSNEQVVNAFLSGEAHGYLAAEGAGVSVTWWWLREVLRLLERRHLLVNP